MYRALDTEAMLALQAACSKQSRSLHSAVVCVLYACNSFASHALALHIRVMIKQITASHIYFYDKMLCRVMTR